MYAPISAVAAPIDRPHNATLPFDRPPLLNSCNTASASNFSKWPRDTNSPSESPLPARSTQQSVQPSSNTTFST